MFIIYVRGVGKLELGRRKLHTPPLFTEPKLLTPLFSPTKVTHPPFLLEKLTYPPPFRATQKLLAPPPIFPAPPHVNNEHSLIENITMIVGGWNYFTRSLVLHNILPQPAGYFEMYNYEQGCDLGVAIQRPRDIRYL